MERNAKRFGTERTQRNLVYNQAGALLWRELERLEMSNPAAEAATLLWHIGAWRLAEEGVDVLDPLAERARESWGNPLESTATKRWRSQEPG